MAELRLKIHTVKEQGVTFECFPFLQAERVSITVNYEKQKITLKQEDWQDEILNANFRWPIEEHDHINILKNSNLRVKIEMEKELDTEFGRCMWGKLYGRGVIPQIEDGFDRKVDGVRRRMACIDFKDGNGMREEDWNIFITYTLSTNVGGVINVY